MPYTNTFVINNIAPEVSVEYIGYKMYKLGIAKIKSVTIGNVVGEHNIEYQRSATVTVEQWCETEAAYNFLKKLNNSSIVEFVIHYAPRHTWNIIRSEDFGDCYGYITIKSFAIFDKNYYDNLEHRIKLDPVNWRINDHECFNANVTLRRHQSHFAPKSKHISCK